MGVLEISIEEERTRYSGVLQAEPSAALSAQIAARLLLYSRALTRHRGLTTWMACFSSATSGGLAEAVARLHYQSGVGRLWSSQQMLYYVMCMCSVLSSLLRETQFLVAVHALSSGSLTLSEHLFVQPCP
jgi:hypothetical protein